MRSISATRLSVLCPANAGRYFAAVAGGPDFILKLVADNEVGGVNPKIPEMKENIRPASARPDKPETTAVAGFQGTNRHGFLVRLLNRLANRAGLGKSPSTGKIGLQIEIDRDADHASAGGADDLTQRTRFRRARIIATVRFSMVGVHEQVAAGVVFGHEQVQLPFEVPSGQSSERNTQLVA